MPTHRSACGGDINTNCFDWKLDENNINATDAANIEIIGTHTHAGQSWTVGRKNLSEVQVFLIIKDGCHAMVLQKGCFYTTNEPNKEYQYVLLDRLGDQQNFRLIDDITKYGNYATMQFIECGTTTATADELVQVLKADLKLRWVEDIQRPRADGQESFDLFFALRVLHGLGVLQNVAPVKSRLWTEEQMEGVIKFVDPSWNKPERPGLLKSIWQRITA